MSFLPYIFFIFGIFSSLATAADRPNIVLILADDLGYSDLGCYGGEIDTPNLDRLASNGLKFSRFYNAGRCCPTRASLLTGSFPHKAGIGHMTYDAGEPGYRGDLNPDTPTIAEALKEEGYRTGMFGKWHVTPNTKPNSNRSNWPCQRGFDRFYGTLPGYGSLWNPAGLYDNNKPINAGDDFFYTDTVADEAIKFISKKSDDPFFAYIPFTAPHYPIHAREKTIKKYQGVYDKGWDQTRTDRFARLKQLGLVPEHAKLPPRDEGSIPWVDAPYKEWQAHRMAVYAAMIDEMDQAIGRIASAVKDIGKLDNTLIVFLSDNGGSPEGHLNNTIERLEKPWVSSLIPKKTRNGEEVVAGDIPGRRLGGEDTFGSYGLRWASVSNTPFRRHKAWMHEGGICSPCIMHWPAGIAPGQLANQAGHIIDLLPTFLSIAKGKTPKSDGQDLSKMFSGGKIDRDFLAWEHEGNRAIRQGPWKLVSEFPGTWKYFYPYTNRGEWELYHLEKDPTELNNLASENTEKVSSLSKLYQQWADANLVVDWEKLEGKKE